MKWGTLLLLMAIVAVPAHAQRMALTVTGFPVVFPTPTAADLDAGFINSATASTFTVQVLSGNPTRVTTVSIRCQTPCPASGTKPVSALQWRRADQSGWNTLTTSDVVIESRTVQPPRGPAGNNPWSNSLYWQMMTGWTTDPPGTHVYNIVVTLTVTSS